MRSLVLVLAVVSCAAPHQMKTRPAEAAVASGTMRTAAELEASGAADRSRAAFREASKVLLHARCVNCHPPDERPRQREAHELHQPPVDRGPDDHGPTGMGCATCHQLTNVELTRLPGAPNWHLAPLKIAWLGRTAAQICAQLKDPARNGNRTLADIVEHSAKDPLVGWGWAPGADREPVPGTQAQFGELMAVWADNGAFCDEETR